MENKQLNINAQPYTPQNPLPVMMIQPQPTSPVVLAGFTYQYVFVSDLSWYIYYYPIYAQYDAVSDPMVKYHHCTPIKNTFRKKDVSKVGGRGGGGKTTVMIKNVPNQFERNNLVHFLDEICGYYNLAYDFVYLPIDFITEMNLGYGFVNFTKSSAAKLFMKILNGYEWSKLQNYFGNFSSLKVCETRWADIQGREKLVEHFQKQTFLRGKNTDWFPVLFTPPRDGFNRTTGKNIEIDYKY